MSSPIKVFSDTLRRGVRGLRTPLPVSSRQHPFLLRTSALYRSFDPFLRLSSVFTFPFVVRPSLHISVRSPLDPLGPGPPTSPPPATVTSGSGWGEGGGPFRPTIMGGTLSPPSPRPWRKTLSKGSFRCEPHLPPSPAVGVTDRPKIYTSLVFPWDFWVVGEEAPSERIWVLESGGPWGNGERIVTWTVHQGGPDHIRDDTQNRTVRLEECHAGGFLGGRSRGTSASSKEEGNDSESQKVWVKEEV